MCLVIKKEELINITTTQMGGVKLMDMLNSLYRIPLQAYPWYISIQYFAK